MDEPTSISNYAERKLLKKGRLTKNARMSSVSSLDSEGLPMSQQTSLKHELLQILGTALAVAAVVVPLLQWGIDAKMSEIKTMISEQDRRFEQRSVYFEKYIDARLDGKSK
jgi:hypothetical protein